MRKFLLAILVLMVLAAVTVVWYLHATTPQTSAGIHFPLTPTQRELLASVPESAEAFALIPTAAVVRTKLEANPITRRFVQEVSQSQQLPSSWMLGGADLLVWRTGKQTSYAVRLDPLRGALVRLYLMFASGAEAHLSGGMLLVNATPSTPLGDRRADELLSIANGLDAGDGLVVQQGRSRAAFPPIGRPAVTTIRIGSDDVTMHSVAPHPPYGRALTAPQRVRFPQNALASATFQDPPRMIGDLDRLFIAKLSHLLDDGGSIVLYDVNAGTLLPRPDGVIVTKPTTENRATVEKIEDAVKTFGDVRVSDSAIVLSFDRDSLTKFTTDSFVEAQWPSNDWSARLDPRRALPILDRLGGNAGFRLAASRLYRSSRDLERWIEYLSQAESLEAAHSIGDTTEELRVRVASK